jgi:hypothetical protein
MLNYCYAHIWDIRKSHLVAYFSWSSKFHRFIDIEKFLY